MTTLTVALPTYNPRSDYLQRVLASLRAQTVSPERWAFVLVDNNSHPPIAESIDLSWHPRGRVIVEPTQGKMHAIATAFRSTQSELVMFLDDDTVAAADLIEQTLQIGDCHTMLGAWSPRVDLELEDASFEVPPRLRALLSERLVDAAAWSNDPNHTPSTPWGGGMCVRRAVADAYLAQTADNPKRLQLDPMGDQPGYGGDTDLSYTACSIGLGMGVFPQLRITHLIPARRCTLDYLLRNLEAHEFSHYMQHHARTGRQPASSLRDRARRILRWTGADTLGRQMMAAEDRGRASARRAIATSTDGRPVTHR
jgi:GT2 family glycosyltransferase